MGNCVTSLRAPTRAVVGNPIHDDEASHIDHNNMKGKQSIAAVNNKRKKKKKEDVVYQSSNLCLPIEDHSVAHDQNHAEHYVAQDRIKGDHSVAKEDHDIKEKLRELEREDSERRLKIEHLMLELDQTRKMVLDYQQEQSRFKEIIVELEVTAQRASQTSIESLQEERKDLNSEINLNESLNNIEDTFMDESVDNVSVITNPYEERSQVEFLDSTLNRVTSELAASQMLISQYENERLQFMQELSHYQGDVQAITDNLQSDLKMMTLRAEVAERQLDSSQRT